MIAVLGLWEKDWMDHERTERRIWKQTIQAYNVDRWCMAVAPPGQFTSPIQYAHIDDMFNAPEHQGVRTFLVAPRTMEGTPLQNYEHPQDAIYVFGDAADNLVRFIRPQDHVVSIFTPSQAAMFAHAVVGTVLFDRARKL